MLVCYSGHLDESACLLNEDLRDPLVLLELVVKVTFDLFFTKAYTQNTIAAVLGHLTNFDACNPKLAAYGSTCSVTTRRTNGFS